MLDYIPEDGYTEAKYVEAQHGIHNAIRFEHRPLLIEEQAEQGDGKLKGAALDRKCQELLAKRITSWSLVDANGSSLDITIANMARLKPTLFNKLYAVVLGLSGGDVDPKAAETDTRSSAQREAANTGN